MIIDRHEPMNLFALVPKLYSDFAPDLGALDRLLADDVIFQRIKADRARWHRRSLSAGRLDGGAS